MDGEGGLVEVALELKARLVHKFLVVRVAGDRRELAGGVEGPNPLQVDVEKTVGAREQASRFRWSMLAEGHDQRDHSHNQQNDQGDGEAASNAHGISEGTRLIRYSRG